jgi:LemA protein
MEGWIVAGVAAVVALWIIVVYNRLVAKRNQVRNGWSQIDVQLKRRHDLVPNLVSAVKGYLEHERASSIRCRAHASRPSPRAPCPSGRRRRTRSPGRALAVRGGRGVSGAPRQREHARAPGRAELDENRVGFARQFYSDAVQDYNTAREVFPASLVARSLGFAPAEPFDLQDPTERATPQVRF